MTVMNFRPGGPAGFFSRFLHWIAAFDTETLYHCPASAWSSAAAIGILMVFTWIYQAALFSLIGHRLYSPDSLSIVAILVSAFCASFILFVDSFMIMRSGHHAAGVEALKRAGLDVSGGKSARVKARVSLGLRIFLSIGLAQLTAIMASLLIFHADIDARLHGEYLAANAHLLPIATAAADRDIQRTTDVLSAEMARELALASQINNLRQNQIDPAAHDPGVRQAEQELAGLIASRDRADADVRRAQGFASDELGGVQGAPGNSGLAGNGPRRRAAIEAIANAQSQARLAAETVEAARKRLFDLRQQNVSSNDTTRQQAHNQLPEYERTLTVEQKKLADVKEELAKLTRDRGATIAAAVAASPDYVKEERGFLAQIVALEHIAASDSMIRSVIWIIDLTSFGFELAAVLAKVTSWVPSRYNTLVASEAYMDEVRIVDEMMTELNHEIEAHVSPKLIAPPTAPSQDNFITPEEPPPLLDPFGGHLNASAEPPQAEPVKRGRGRPRKHRLH